MSNAIFDLDEEREQNLTHKPAISTSQPTSHPVSPVSPVSPTSTSPSAEPSAPRPSNNLLLPQSQPFAGHRRQTASFAATPSFPSPLAQAITVPLNSDASSSSSRSDDDERSNSPVSSGQGTPRREGPIERPRTVSPRPEGCRAGSPSSTEKSASRPPSPAHSRTALTPGSFLIKSKRSTSGPLVNPSSPAVSPLRDSPPRTGQIGKNLSAPNRRFEDISRSPSSSKGHHRGRSGSTSAHSSSSATGSSPRHRESPDLYPIDTTQKSTSSSPTDVKENTLGLGLGWTGWESGSSFGSSAPSSKGKGVDRDNPPSPRRERESSRGPGGISR